MSDAQWRWEPRVLGVDDDPVCQLAARRLFKNLGIAADARLVEMIHRAHQSTAA
jgi:hypothetical protein